MNDERQTPALEEEPVAGCEEEQAEQAAAAVETQPVPPTPATEEPPAPVLPSEQTSAVDTPVQEDITGRLAEEFILLMEEFPQLQSPEQLPETVLDTAAKTGISLLDAYLRYRWQEEKRIRAAAEQRAAAAKQSAGSLARGTNPADPGPELFMKAFRSALR